MRATLSRLFAGILLLPLAAHGQDAKQIVREAVQAELAADAADHSHWLYHEVDQKPDHPVKQWVAETRIGNLRRVLELDGHPLSPEEQQKRMDAFINDPTQRSRQRKNEQHDDKQAEQMLRMLPDAFIWTNLGEKGENTLLHFKPNPDFDPPDMEARVFAAMEGDLIVHTEQHRIASLKGRMIRDVKFFGGLFGGLNAGGTFDIERRELAPRIWQITETHVHISGHVLIFKTISEQEDDVKSEFKRIPDSTTLEQAKEELLAAGK